MNKKVLVIGGGITGLSAALNFGQQGYDTFLVERENTLGGFAKKIYETLEGEDVRDYLKQLTTTVQSHTKIKVFTGVKIDTIRGYIGNFKTAFTFGPSQEKKEFEHGVVIVATGAEEYKPSEYQYGKDTKIILQSQFEKLLHENPASAKSLKNIVMIQCVGSRNEEHPYCSRMCCAEAVKNALKIKEIQPETNVVVLYRDIRTYGFKELKYREAREKGILFIQFEKGKEPQVVSNADKRIVSVENPSLGQISIPADLVVLSAGIVAKSDNKDLAKMLKVPVNEDNFFLEAHVKLRPVDFATEGVFLAGMAHGPKPIENSIAQALATVSRASVLLSRDFIEAEGNVSRVNEDTCVGCGVCTTVCAYNAIVINDKDGKAYINEILCKGCGLCSATCPEKAIIAQHFTREKILAEIYALGGK